MVSLKYSGSKPEQEYQGKLTNIEIGCCVMANLNLMKSNAVACILLLCSSCSSDFLIKTANENGTNVRFYEPGYIWNTEIEPCLKWLRIYEQLPDRDTEEDRVSWAVEATHGSCVKVSEITLGSDIVGFVSTGNLPSSGHRVRVSAQDGRGRYGSSDAFQIRY